MAFVKPLTTIKGIKMKRLDKFLSTHYELAEMIAVLLAAAVVLAQFANLMTTPWTPTIL